MRAIRALVAALAVFGFGNGVAQKKPPPAFRISGLVVNSRDDSPVRRCVVTASLAGGGRGGGREPLLTTTDERGHFALSVPSAGNWELRASAHNIHSQPLDGHDGYFTGVILTPQSPTYEVVFRAVPDALLRGAVTDEAGEPVRNAQVTLYAVNHDAGQTGGAPMQQRGGAQTDDRGRFEVAGLDPGAYMVQVQARAWYAAGGPGRVPTVNLATAPPLPDPSLDVTYPATWYPGVTDASAAGVLTAHAGDVLEADFHLSAEPAAHLVVPASGPQVTQVGRDGVQFGPGGPQNPNVALVLPDGSLQQVFGQISRTATGDLDVSGLAPGTYQVTMPGNGPGVRGPTTMVRVQGGSSVALSAAAPETAVTIDVDGGTEVEAGQIVLVDRATGQTFSSFGRGDGGMRPPGNRPGPGGAPGGRGGQGGARGRPAGGQGNGFGQRGRARGGADGEEVTMQVPPGEYDVAVRGDAFLTGITASKGAVAVGRSVTIPEGAVRLGVHLATGFATVKGIASLAGKASVGAMVLLVPATLGETGSLTVIRRDQTNSDGSFSLESVVPGEYILVAIDHGWGVPWTDSSKLQPYLMQGTPLELRSAMVVNTKVAALAP